jgi:hypothetical protein
MNRCPRDEELEDGVEIEIGDLFSEFEFQPDEVEEELL